MTTTTLRVAAMVALLSSSAALAEPPRPEQARPRALRASLEAFAKASSRVELHTIGHSLGQRPIVALRIAAPGPREPEARPALLVVAGLDGDRRLGTALSVAFAQRLAAAADDSAEAKLLQRVAIWLIPQANPDGVARALTLPGGPLGNRRKIDRDRDGQRGEDGPTDLDGDGTLRWVRVADPHGEWIPHPGEPRLMRRARPLDGERGTHRLFREGGSDDDGDGAIDEDPAAGVRINRNFPHRFARWTPASGQFPLSEPTSKALADFVIAHPQIHTVLTYGAEDNLAGPPPAGKLEHRKPLVHPHPHDIPLLHKLGERYRQALGAPKRGHAALPGGSFQEWAYYHRGLLSLSVNPLLAPPPAPALLPLKEAPAPEQLSDAQRAELNKQLEGAVATATAELARGRADLQAGRLDAARYPLNAAQARLLAIPLQSEARQTLLELLRALQQKLEQAIKAAPKPAPHPELAWLRWADRLGAGHMKWTAREHPKLGAHEIGGFHPTFMTIPPAALIDELAPRHAAYLTALAGLLPQISLLDAPRVRPVAPGIWRVIATVHNDGFLPSRIVMGSHTRAVAPLVLKLSGGELMGGPDGRPLQVLPALASGQRHQVAWIIKGDRKVTLELRDSRRGFGRVLEVELKETK